MVEHASSDSDTTPAPEGPAEGDHAATSPGSALGQVPIEVTVAIGRARPLVGELMQLGPDSVLPLDTRVDDPVELFVGGRLIARAALAEIDDPVPGTLAVRLLEVAAPGKAL